MIHLSDFTQVTLDKPSIVAIGVFDGVHRGHQHLLRQLVETARAAGQYAVAITFYPHPDVYFRKVDARFGGRYYLTTPAERAALMGELGIDYVVTLPFDDALRVVRAADFVDRLRQHLNMQSLWIGQDFALGYKREGTPETLTALGTERGFNVRIVDLLLTETGERISSSAVREVLLKGEVERAADLLGRPYRVSGAVVHGEARGRLIGFPTANMDVWREQILPMNGIYAGWAYLGEGVAPERFMAVANIGVRPTFDGQGVTVEPYILDFDRQIYGQTLAFTFDKFLRPEERYPNVDALIAQIRLDVEQGRAFLEGQDKALREGRGTEQVLSPTLNP